MSGVRPCSCGKPRAKSWHLACPDCWSLIPQPLQELVYRLFREAQGSDDHIAAVRRCYEAIRAARNGEPVCRVCGCTDACCQACIERTGAPCHWVDPDLCSACRDEFSDAQCDLDEANEAGDLEDRLDAAMRVADIEEQHRRAARALETEM